MQNVLPALQSSAPLTATCRAPWTRAWLPLQERGRLSPAARRKQLSRIPDNRFYPDLLVICYPDLLVIPTAAIARPVCLLSAQSVGSVVGIISTLPVTRPTGRFIDNGLVRAVAAASVVAQRDEKPNESRPPVALPLSATQ
jgi:hypothetical protein